jgi:hypothetical protein
VELQTRRSAGADDSEQPDCDRYGDDNMAPRRFGRGDVSGTHRYPHIPHTPREYTGAGALQTMAAGSLR